PPVAGGSGKQCVFSHHSTSASARSAGYSAGSMSESLSAPCLIRSASTSDVCPARDFSARAARTCSSVSGFGSGFSTGGSTCFAAFFFSGFCAGFSSVVWSGGSCPPCATASATACKLSARERRSDTTSRRSFILLMRQPSFRNLPDGQFLHRAAWNDDRQPDLVPQQATHEPLPHGDIPHTDCAAVLGLFCNTDLQCVFHLITSAF